MFCSDQMFTHPPQPVQNQQGDIVWRSEHICMRKLKRLAGDGWTDAVFETPGGFGVSALLANVHI